MILSSMEMDRIPSRSITLHLPAIDQQVSAIHTPANGSHGSHAREPAVVFLLGHGLTNNREHPLLVGYLEGLARQEVHGLRFNFPYRERGESAPDARDVLFTTLDAALGWAASTFGPQARLVLGGKSLAARMSAAHQARFGKAHAMVYLGFPLHPPDDKTQLRGRDLGAITVPQYCASGDQDPFCDLALFAPIHQTIETPFHLEVIPGGDHGLGVEPGADPAQAAAVLSRLVESTSAWLDAALR